MSGIGSENSVFTKFLTRLQCSGSQAASHKGQGPCCWPRLALWWPLGL